VNGPRIRVLSLGAGVQSTTLLLLACQDRIPRFDAAIFADTSWEPAAVYAHLNRLEQVAASAGIPILRVSSGNIRADALDPSHRFASMPLYVLNPDGGPGLARRQCSAEYKVRPIKAQVRQLLGYPHPRRVPREVYAEQAIGISLDEIGRARDSDVGYMRHVFPLLDLRWRRSDCLDYLTGRGFGDTPRSACVGCLMWNLAPIRCQPMIDIPWDKFPLVAGHEHARRWLQFTANIGRAANTIDAYGRAVEDHLRFCASAGVDPLMIRADTVAAWIGDMFERPNPRSAKVVRLDSGAGLANATIQQRVIAARSFYAFLVEDGLRERNPVRRGQSGRRGRKPKQGLVRRLEQAPWIPKEEGWRAVLDAAGTEPLRNRLMVALAYDGALRREELVQLEVGDFEPAYSLIHLRAVTTKSKRSREVAYGQASAQLFANYLAYRRQRFGRLDGALLRSESRRNAGAPLGLSSWSKIVERISDRSGLPRLATHTFRHLRLTDLARAGWTIDQIAQYAGHRDLSTTMQYIHLSGRELAARLHRASVSIQLDRERLLAALAVTR
jgi:integrase/recombinase XerD